VSVEIALVDTGETQKAWYIAIGLPVSFKAVLKSVEAAATIPMSRRDSP
jgi:hypothetical protein